MTWLPIGPDCTALDARLRRAPVAGAVTCIAFDPRTAGTIYVGTGGGGVWRSTDEGRSWQPLTDAQMCLAIGAIAIGPNTGRIYAGTGDGTRQLQSVADGPMVLKGRGLLVFDPSAGSWQLFTGFTDRFVHGTLEVTEDLHLRHAFHRIVVLPDDPNDLHVLAATSHGLFESTDGGNNWDDLTPGSARGMPVHGLAVDPDDPDGFTIWATVGGGAVSADRSVWRRRGTTWTKVDAQVGSPARIGIALSPTTIDTPTGRRRIVYAVEFDDLFAIQSITRSLDGGATWEDIRDGFGAAAGGFNARIPMPTLVADPEEPRTLYVAAGALLRRKHGASPTWELLGKTAEDVLHRDQLALAFDPHVPTGGRAALWLGNAGGAWRSADGGDTWHHRNRGLANAQLYALAQAPQTDVLLVGSQDNGAQRRLGHPLWRQLDNRLVPSTSSNSAFDAAIDPHRPDDWYYGTAEPSTYGRLYLQRSRDGGENFATIGPVESDSFDRPFYQHMVLVSDRERMRLVVAGKKTIRSSTNDDADGWTTIVDDALAGRPTLTHHISAITVLGQSLYVGTSFGSYTERDLTHGGARHAWQLRRIHLPRPAGAPPEPDLGEVEEMNELISSIAVSPDRQNVHLGIGTDRIPGRLERTKPWTANSPALSRVMSSNRAGVGSDLPPSIPFTGPLAFVPRGPGAIDGLAESDNAVHVVAIDPANPLRVFVGCDVGVFRSDDGGEHYVEWRQGLPNAVVTDIEIEAEALPGHPRMVRVSTYGRGAFERPLAASDSLPAATSPDIYLRLHAGFTRRPEPTRPEELAGVNELLWAEDPDLRIQRKRAGKYPKPASTEDYTPDGPLDYLGFEALPRKQLKRATESRLHVQVHNRGPVVATGVEVRMFWAAKNGDRHPDLPLSFWHESGFGMPMNINVWKPIGDVVVIDRIQPAHPRIATFEWTVPDDPPAHASLLAVITCPGDPLVKPTEAPLDVERLARENKRVLLTTAKITGGTDHSRVTFGDVMRWAGVAVVLGVVAYGTVKAIEDA